MTTPSPVAPKPASTSAAPAKPTIIVNGSTPATGISANAELQAKLIRLSQLETANAQILTSNQKLQLENDNLGVQIKVLQSETSAQMFLYGAVTLAVGIMIGMMLSFYFNRHRRW